MAILRPEGTSEPPPSLQAHPPGPTRPEGGHCGKEAGRRWHWAAGLGAAHLLRSRRWGQEGLISPATSAAPGPCGEGSRCLQWAKQGGNHRHLPPTVLLAESCQLPAATAQSRSTKVRCREVVAGSAPPGARLAAPPHLQAPPQGPALRREHPSLRVSGPCLPFRRRPTLWVPAPAPGERPSH